MSWYDESAERVLKGKKKLEGDKLEAILHRLGCTAKELPHYGYSPTGKAHEYALYESESDLRDYENIPLKEDIYAYFLREVVPHVAEAWINLEKTKIGYEISFNKYFYQHKSLPSLEEVSKEILELERQSEGLIQEILGI